MSGVETAALGFGVLLGLMALRIPIGVAMLAVGITGYASLNGIGPLLAYWKTAPYYQFSTYSLSVIPLFVLMGEFATHSGLSRALFRAAAAFLGHRRGGLAMAAIGGCAAFGAICGSSLATAATMTRVALPEMRRYGYSGRLATGALAAGGTLGALIPPSVILILYALMTEQNIATMFVAAVIPGAVAVLGYMAAIALIVRRDPEAGPAGPHAGWREKARAIRDTWAIAVLFLLVLTGMYRGWFTPTEGASVGAFGTFVLALVKGGLRWAGLMECLLGTARTTGMIFLILFGAETFNAFLGLTGAPMLAARAIAESGMAPLAVMAAILVLYLVLGCVMDSMSMMLLTIPIFYPIIAALDFGMTPNDALIWFGVLTCVVVEVGVITPPVGMNVFIINGIAKDLPISETFRGVLPFFLADLVRITLLVAFPMLTLGLVRVLG